MSFTMGSILGALGFLFIGMAELVLIDRTLYPVLRQRYEQAKVTQSQGVDPSRIMNLVRFQSLVVMPVLGFLLGDRLKAMLG